jgi:hypothetical protein
MAGVTRPTNFFHLKEKWNNIAQNNNVQVAIYFWLTGTHFVLQ